MRTLVIILVVLAIGALVTAIGSWLIACAHPARGGFVKVRRLRQHVVELGRAGASAAPIVLIHGAGCNLEDMWLALGERLAVVHRVILIDRPGMGWSKRSGREGSSPRYQAAILHELLTELGVERAIIVGHSWGGALAASFALDFPEQTAALALLAPPLYPLARGTTWLYALFATPVLGWIYAHTLVLPLSLPFIGLGMASAFLPQLPPSDYFKRSATLLLLRPSSPMPAMSRTLRAISPRRPRVIPSSLRRRSSLAAIWTSSLRPSLMRSLLQRQCRMPNWSCCRVWDTCSIMRRRIGLLRRS